MFQRGSKFYSKISSGGSIFSEKLVPGGTNFGGSIFAMTVTPITINAHLTVGGKSPKHHLDSLKEVHPHDAHLGASRHPAFVGIHRNDVRLACRSGSKCYTM